MTLTSQERKLLDDALELVGEVAEDVDALAARMQSLEQAPPASWARGVQYLLGLYITRANIIKAAATIGAAVAAYLAATHGVPVG